MVRVAATDKKDTHCEVCKQYSFVHFSDPFTSAAPTIFLCNRLDWVLPFVHYLRKID